ncbi:MAG: hypothetical protein FJW79_02300 [Actinobacteria bacterium]|nr:hypothetical protein [Actinomycetota bacterium]
MPVWLALSSALVDTANRTWVYDSATRRVAELRAGSYRFNPTNPQTSLQRAAYTYDNAGLITTIIDYRNSSQRLCYQYNLRGMLTRAFTGDSDCAVYEPAVGADPFNHTYGYDPVGNITAFTGISGWSYGAGNEPGPGDAGPHAVMSAGGVYFTYDDAGNQTGRTQAGATTAYSYNADGRLSSITPPAGAGWVFRYDADGSRVRVQHGPGAFTYHIGGLLEVDTTAAGGAVTATRSAYPLGGGVTAVRTNTKTGGSWTPAGSDRVDYTFGDHLGSVGAVWTEGDPGTRFLQRYYPWGAPAPPGTQACPPTTPTPARKPTRPVAPLRG